MPVLRTLGVAAAALLLSSCLMLNSYQSPRVLARGEGEAGLALSCIAADGDGACGVLDLYGRFGVSENFDAGFRMTGIPPFGAIMLDGKYQVLRSPFLVSAGLGASVFLLTFDDEEEDADATIGVYPTVLAGTDRFYVGFRGIYALAGDYDFAEPIGSDDGESREAEWVPTALVGLNLGGRVRVRPELTVLFLPGEDPVYMGGIAVGFAAGSPPD